MSDTLASHLSPTLAHEYSLLRESCGHYPLKDWSLFEIAGEDRKAWLQGQMTNDIRQLRIGGSLPFCICSPTGQILALCTGFALQDRYLVLTPRACADAFAERVSTMVIMEDVTCEEITTGYDWHSLQGPSATKVLSDVCEVPTMDVGVVDGAYLFRVNRTGLGGWDLLTPKSSALKKAALKASEPVSPEAVDIARLEAGIPIYGKDINERTLPPEVGEDFAAKHVSYSKGCYTGQEVLMRIHSRGHTNKTWVGLLLDDRVSPGDRVSTPDREEAGVITSFIDSPKYGMIGAAVLRNEASAEGTEIAVHGTHGTCGGEVVFMPILRYA